MRLENLKDFKHWRSSLERTATSMIIGLLNRLMKRLLQKRKQNYKCLFKGTVKQVFRLFIAVHQTILKLCGLNQILFISHFAIDQGG